MEKTGIILKVEKPAVYTIGNITGIKGDMLAKYVPLIIDNVSFEAIPKTLSTGRLTDAIQKSIVTNPDTFSMKTKGILLAFTGYEILDRGRFRFTMRNPLEEGVLDGGSVILAIGLAILQRVHEYMGSELSYEYLTWEQFKDLWDDAKEGVSTYLQYIKDNPDIRELSYHIPIEIIVPRTSDDVGCVEEFVDSLSEICYSRNNHAEHI